MADERPSTERKRRRSFGPDGKTPVLYFDDVTVATVTDYIQLSLFDTERDPSDPDKTPVRYLGTRLKGAKALRDALEEAIARWEETAPKD